MRVSLATRIFAGYLVVLALLGGVATYSIVTMQRMKEEVLVFKQGVLPISAKFQRLSRDLLKASTILREGKRRELGWLSKYLPEMKPFETLSELKTGLEQLAERPGLDEHAHQQILAAAEKTGKLVEGANLKALAERELGAGTLGAAEIGNAAAYGRVLEQYLAPPLPEAAEDKPVRKTPAPRLALQRVIDEVRRVTVASEALYDLGTNTLWSGATEREEAAVRLAIYLGLAALVIIVAVLLLFLRWLKPLAGLRAYAQRISMGDYESAVPLRPGDEIGDLALELKKMAARLKEREEMVRSQARELVRADRFSTIGKMATQIAHEIRNPLNALGLKLELLEESVEAARDRLGPEAHQALTAALSTSGKEIDRLREITEYYLKFAKFPKVEKEAVDLHPVLNDIVSFYEEEARGQGLEVEREIEKPLRGLVDPNLLRHAMANLLKNAIEAIVAGGGGAGRIVVRAWREQGRIRISVADNGPGIRQDALSRVFEPFFSGKKGGTGLGLTLVQQIIAEHGGEITCSSTPAEGTVFRFSLPE